MSNESILRHGSPSLTFPKMLFSRVTPAQALISKITECQVFGITKRQ